MLVPGACHGGWWYEEVAAALEARGHEAIPLTLRGLEDDPDTRTPITLDSHISQVLAALRQAGAGAARGRPVVLVAHSYGGLPSIAAADRRPDASPPSSCSTLPPEDGDSCWTLTNQRQRDWFITGSGRTGVGVDPPSSFDERTRPHPIGSLLQQVRLSPAWRKVAVRHYVSVPWPGPSPLAVSTARAQADGVVMMHESATQHDVLRDGPERVTNLLAQVAAELRARPKVPQRSPGTST